MTILHIINNLSHGGAERILVDTAPSYSSLGHDITILQLNDKNSSSEYLATLERSGIKCLTLGQFGLYSPVKIIQLVNHLNKNDYDILHVHLFPALYWVAIASKFTRRQIQLVFTEHSTENKRFGKPYLRHLESWIYNSYTKVIVISEAIKSKLDRWANITDKIELIRNGVNVNQFIEAKSYPDSYWETQFSIPAGAMKLMMTARFGFPKDHITLIESLKFLPDYCYLILAGNGPNVEYVKHYVDANGLSNRIRFAGFRMDIPSLMKSVNLNILSSQYEGMSGVTLEALASGVPFLGSNVKGINDVVPDDRFLFEAGNSYALAQKIDTILFKDIEMQKSMITEGLKYVRKFDVSLMIDKHINLYKGLLKR
ncbi:hypothetical protein DYBT9275_03831 [Dyadobacter sp. CECT 9275]|uniref:Glycosyltransferase n=1 Tax=Dyadobacter helix TaxID=2822344 RepID=A0A916JFC3_9BACT|nr:glycosyltransferase [Dyadobacter sp. CECT 9275]CAG5006498.1 hypothetical protein DYBT9275_03831 [Dyadobacter sp. CECT 9275]